MIGAVAGEVAIDGVLVGGFSQKRLKTGSGGMLPNVSRKRSTNQLLVDIFEAK